MEESEERHLIVLDSVDSKYSKFERLYKNGILSESIQEWQLILVSVNYNQYPKNNLRRIVLVPRIPVHYI